MRMMQRRSARAEGEGSARTLSAALSNKQSESCGEGT